MNNLKPCPFCGSSNIERFITLADISPTGENCYTNHCVDCGGSTAAFPTQEDADDAWNQRAKEKTDA